MLYTTRLKNKRQQKTTIHLHRYEVYVWAEVKPPDIHHFVLLNKEKRTGTSGNKTRCGHNLIQPTVTNRNN